MHQSKAPEPTSTKQIEQPLINSKKQSMMPGSMNRILQMQKQLGNRAVTHMLKSQLQRKNDPIQKADIVDVTVGALTEPIGGKYSIDLTCNMDDGTTHTVNVNVSWQKHVMEAYRTREVTTPPGGVGVNTIATISLDDFKVALQEWATECATKLQNTGLTWVSNGVTFATTKGISFSTDRNQPNVHSFPVAGNVVTLTDTQYALLKLLSKAYYRHGNYVPAAKEVNSQFDDSGNPTVDLQAGITALGIGTDDLKTHLKSIIDTDQYNREENIWMNRFLRTVGI